MRPDDHVPLFRDRTALVFLPALVLVVLFYFWTALTNGDDPNTPSSQFYPLLAKAFCKGQLYLDVVPAPELLALPNPYDPKQNAPYRMHDASLYQGKYYIYFGPTPAVILFAPYYLLTGSDFPQKMAVALFCSTGFILSAILFLMMVGEFFPRAPLWLKLACVFSLGLANTCPFLIRRPDVYEAAIGCAYALLQLALLSFYCALRKPQQALPWLLLASASLGASMGARFSYSLIVMVFFAIVIWMWWQDRSLRLQRPWLPLSVLAPLGFIGLALAWYNFARFGSVFEMGVRYQLAGVEVSKIPFTGIDNIPYTSWIYFFSMPHYSWNFPFVYAEPYAAINKPDHFFNLENIAGLFVIAPVSLCALTLPTLLRRLGKPGEKPLVLTLLFMVVTTLTNVFSILCISGTTMRYFVDFAPGFIFLGCLMLCYFCPATSQKNRVEHGLLSIVFALILFLGCWNGVLLSFTGYYNFLLQDSPQSYIAVKRLFQPAEALGKIFKNSSGGDQQASANLIQQGDSQLQAGQIQEAVNRYMQALQIDPDNIGALKKLGAIMVKQGYVAGAQNIYLKTLALDPEDVEANANLGNILLQSHQMPAAIQHYELALEADPNQPVVRNNLGIALAMSGRIPEAIEQFQTVLRDDPNDKEALDNLSRAQSLEKTAPANN